MQVSAMGMFRQQPPEGKARKQLKNLVAAVGLEPTTYGL
jgi:hypothetical protein